MAKARSTSLTLAFTASAAPAKVRWAPLRFLSSSTAFSPLVVLTFSSSLTAGSMRSSPAEWKRRPAISTSGP
jgi:hypothetical protein